jgi:hypothetical protein
MDVLAFLLVRNDQQDEDAWKTRILSAALLVLRLSSSAFKSINSGRQNSPIWG